MKTILRGTALLSLAARDSGLVIDQEIRSSLRESAIKACTAWIPQSDIAAAAGPGTDKICGCAADHVLENASQLADLKSSTVEIRTAVAQCAAEVRTPLSLSKVR